MTELNSSYKVGFGKPPEETRFRKGRSGNPKGRPKGSRNFKTDLREELAEPVRVHVDGKAQTISSQQAAMKQLRAKALKGDQRALDRLLGLAERYDFEESADETEQELAVADQQILQRFVDRIIGEHEAEKSEDQTRGKEAPGK